MDFQEIEHNGQHTAVHWYPAVQLVDFCLKDAKKEGRKFNTTRVLPKLFDTISDSWFLTAGVRDDLLMDYQNNRPSVVSYQ